MTKKADFTSRWDSRVAAVADGGAPFGHIDTRLVDYRGAPIKLLKRFQGQNFSRVDFSRADFQNVWLEDCAFERCRFDNAYFADVSDRKNHYHECVSIRRVSVLPNLGSIHLHLRPAASYQQSCTR